MSTGTIQIPVLFDMSGDSVVYGEDATGADFVDSHLQFLLDMTTAANDISLNAADISSAILVADQDTGDNIFFDGDSNGIGIDNLCNRIAKAITRGKLVHIPSIGNFSNSGIPIGGEKYLYNNLGQIQDPGTYTLKYTDSIAPIGDEQMLGQAMARVASVHLIGDPLGSAAFEDATSIQTELETASTQTFNQGNTAFFNALAVQLSKVLGGSKSSAPMNPGILIGSDAVATPVDVTSTNSTITGQTYTASSAQHGMTHSTYGVQTAFNDVPSTGFWHSTSGTFNSGIASSSIVTGIDGYNTNSWSGIWLKIDLGQTVVLSEYKIHSRPSSTGAYTEMSPREGYFVSSLDGENWHELHHLNLDATTGQTLYYDGTNVLSIDTDLTGVNNKEGRYFAFIVKKVFGGNYASIGELQLFGVTKAEYDGGSPPAAYDVASSNSTLHNTTDNRVISAANMYNASYAPEDVFNDTPGSGGNADSWISQNGSFSNGEIHTNFQHLKLASGLMAEWIQVDVGQLVYTPKFLIDSVWDQSDQYKAKDFTLYASKDGNTYYAIKSYTATTGEYYNATTGYSPIFIDIDSANPPADETDNRIARYFKLGITSTIGAGNHVRIQQFTLYGIKYPTQFGTAPATSTTIYEPNITPYDVTSTNSSLAGAATHIKSASSSNHGHTHGTYGAMVPWNNALGNGTQMWFSSGNRYSTTNASGNYTGYQYTGDLSGEWIQIDLSENVLATYYTINGYRHATQQYNIKKGYLLSSLDGTRWNLAHTLTVNSNDDWYTSATGANVQRHEIPNSDARKGKYWRFVINSTFGGHTHCYIDELQIFGAKYPSEVTEGNGALTTNSVSKYTLNVTPYDCTSSSSTGITGSIITGQTYSASSSNNNPVSNAFNNTPSSYWQIGAYYYNTAGDLSGSYYGMSVTEGYPGEWIQVDVGRLITATNCIFSGYQHTTQFAYSPHSGVILSSLDGKKWNFITEWTNGVENVAGETWYNNNGYRDKNIPLSGVHATARYFRMVLTKGNGVYTSVVLSNFKILGAKNPEEVTQGEHTITNSNIPSYVPTVSSYEIADSVTSPLAHRAEHIYTASTANHGFTHNDYGLPPLFNYAQETQNDYWLSKAGYNTGDGTYSGSHYTGDLSGEWIQVDLSENVYVTKAIIMPYYHTTNFTRNVRKGYLLSSLDGKKWNLIHTHDDPSAVGSAIYSNETFYPICLNITSTEHSIGRYFRFIVNKTYTSGYAHVPMGKFRLYGVRYPSQVTEGDGATDTTTLISYTPTATPYEIHELEHSAQHIYSASEENHVGHSSYGAQVVWSNNPVEGVYWYPRTANFRYSTTTGKYQGGSHTNDISGEWVQVDLSENILIRKYQVHPSWSTSHTDETVRKGSLLSSLDGLKWNLVDTFQNTDEDGSSYYVDSTFTYKERDVSGNHTVGKHFRFVVQETYNKAYPLIGQIRLFGVKHPSETSQGDIVIDMSNNKPGYTLTASAFDLTSPDSILTGQTYSASSENHPGHSSYRVQVAFKNPVDGGTGTFWYPIANRYSSTGNYQGGVTTVDSSGEWIQVDLSENVFIDHYHLNASYGNTTTHAKAAPKAGTLFSSLDGLKWEQVHTFDLSGDTVYYTDGNYRPQRFDITKTPNSIGRYFRFVVNKNFGDVNTLVRNFTIYGVKYPSQVTNTNILIEPALEINANWTTDQSLSFDVASSNSTLNGQTYTASSYAHGETHTNYGIQNTFNGIPSAGNYWIPYNTTTAGNMYSADGSYFGHKRTGNYYGAWVQVDVGQNVKITNYKIHPVPWTNSNYTRNVKKGHLLSSLDGEKWNFVHTHNDTSTTTVTTYRSNAHSYDLAAPNTTGRYFRFVMEETYGGIASAIGELEIKGTLTTAEHYGSSYSTAERYNTFSVKDNVTPYDIYTRSLAYTTTPYLISTQVSSTVPIDIVSQNSTVSGQSYSATYGTAGNAFDNSENTEWSTDASSNYGIISPLITNEPDFTSWTTTTDGIITTFSENITVATVDKSNFSIYDSSENSAVVVDGVEISTGKLLVKPMTGYIRNDNNTPYDLTSTSSTIYGTRGEITYSSQYGGGFEWEKAFNDTLDGPGITGSGSYNGGNPVNAPNTVVSGVTYNGHWVQIDVGQQVFVQTFEYTDRGAHPIYEWDTLLLAGSNDGTTWELMWRLAGRTAQGTGLLESYDVNDVGSKQYFRWICEKNHGGVYAWNAREQTLKGHVLTDGSLITFDASKLNDYRITYTKPLNQDNQLTGVTNGVGLQSFVLEDGAVTGRGEYAVLPLSLNEPSFTSSQVIGGPGGWTEDTSVGATKDWRGITSSADGIKLAAVVYEGNIWTSSNSGVTWTENTSIGATKNWRGITSSADGVKLAAVVYYGNIWTSNDSGATWTENTVGNGSVKWMGITSSSDGAKLAAVVWNGNIWTSNDSGATWTEVTVGDGSNSWLGITSSDDGTNLAATVSSGNIWTSNDSGVNWTSRASTKAWQGITSSADGTKMAATVGGGNIWTSNDSGATWTEDTSIGATKNWRGITSSADGTKLVAVVKNGNIWTSNDSGATWTEDTSIGATKNWLVITSSADGTKLAAAVTAPGNIWALTPPAPAQLEYTFSENLQAGAGGFDITDFQLIEPSGNTVDLSSNDCGIVGGKLVIGTYAAGFYPQGNNYALSGVNATHSGTLYYSATPDHNTTHSTDKFHDGDTSTSWLSINDTYVSGTYAGSVSTATTNAGTINGEYVQIDVGVNSILSHFTYYTQDSHKTYSPSSGSLVGSKDNVNWDVITSFSYDKDNDPNEVTKNISTQAEYRYYRLIFAAVHSGGHVCGVNEWTLFGHVRENYYVGETVSDANYMLIYTKNSTVNKNIIGATNNVAINTFRIDNNLLAGRGGVTNIGQYDGSTSTTLTDTSTYKGEYIQIDVGKNVIINNYAMNVKSVNGNDNPKSWMLVGSLNNSDWTKLDEKFNHTLTENYTATVTTTKVRYLRLIINRGGTAKHIKISEFKVNGVEIRLDGQTFSASLDNGDANTVFDNSITTSWDTSSDYNYNELAALATNEPEYSSVSLHTDASGNGQLQLSFNANVSCANILSSNFSVTSLDLSSSEVLAADISGGKIMLKMLAEIDGAVAGAYENFDDQTFTGDVTTADIVAGGRDGTGYCIAGEDSGGDISTKIWKPSHRYKAISFWFLKNNSGNSRGFWSARFEGTYPGWIWLHTHNGGGGQYVAGHDSNTDNKWIKYWIDGVERTPDSNVGSLSSSSWHHIYLEFSDDAVETTFLASGNYGDAYGSTGMIDEVRFFTKGITEAEIIQLYGGWDGTYPGATFPNANYRIEYIKDADSSRHIVKEQANSWSETTVGDGTNNWYGVAMSTDGTKVTIVGHSDNVWTSTDGGATFTQRTVTGSWNNVAMSSDGTKQLIASYDAEMKKSLDSGATWTSTLSGGGNWKDIAMNQDGTKIYAIVYGGTIFKSTDLDNWPNAYGEFKNWHAITTNGDGSIVAAVPFGDEMVLSTDSGANWSTMGPGSKDWTDIAMSDDGTKMVAVVFDGHIYNSTDSGANWTQRGVNKIWRSVTMSSDGTKAFATAHGDFVYTSTDSGATWTADTTASGAGASAAKNWKGTATSSDGNITIAVVDGENIWKLGPPPGIPINNFIIQDGTLISRGTNHGIYRGSTTTTYNTNQTYNGEHINVNTGQETYITDYELHVPAPPNANVGNNIYPKSWILLGSTNGSDWTKIHEVSDYTGWTTNSSYSQGYQVKYGATINNMVAQHYRLIINKTFGKVGYASVAELLINGVKHTSETTGITQVKTASLGTAANAFDANITTDWNTSSSPTYSLIAAAATNEPTFSSQALNSGKLELTFSENVAVTGSLHGNDFNITDSGTRIYVTPTIANNKLVLEYLGIPAEQIYHESFDNEDVTFHANADIVYVTGIGGLPSKAISTIGQSPSGLQWVQKVSDGSLPSNVRAVSFQIKVTSGEYVFDNRQVSGSITDNRAMFFSSGNLRFWNNSNAEGTASGSGYLPGGNQPTIWYDGVKQIYGANNNSSGANVMSESGTVITLTLINDGNWHNFYIEYPDGETLPTDFDWFSRYSAGNMLEATMDDVRYYNAPILQANIDSLAAGGSGGLVGSFTHTNVDIEYTKNATAAQNIVNAAHTSVPVNTFLISNGVEMSRGSAGKGDYRGSTSTTYNTNKTYTGEYVQIDMGQNILMTEYKLHIPSISYSNPQNWKLLYSSNGTDWTEAHDISNNTSWANSSLISNSSYGSGSEFNASTLSNDAIGRYFRLVVNKITGPSNHVKIGELQIKGVMHTMETVSDNNPTPVAATATPSDNTTTVTDSTVTSTTHLNNDTTTTTTTETRIVVAANTETTTTNKTNIQIVTTATPHFGLTETASNTVTTHSDNTVTSTTYANNDTTTRTLVTKTVDISANTNTSTNYNTVITKIINAFAVSMGSSSAFDPNKVFDASGVACPALKSIYEQLMNVPGRSQIMGSRDFTSSPMPSVSTITGGFPFIPGDKLVMYLRPKILFAQATFPEQFTNLLGFGGVTFGEPTVDTALASGGAISGQTYTQSSKYSDTYAGSKLFDSSTTSFWITASDTYNSSTGIAEGGSTTIHADDGGGTYTGHYVQIQFANSVAIEDIKITPRYGGGGGAGEPKEFRILSSDDGTTFRVAYSVAEGDLNNDWSLWSTQTFHLSNLREASSKGQYWRIAIGKITTGNKVQLAKVELIGNLTSSLIDNDVGQPVTTGGVSGGGGVGPIIDLASSNSTLSGQTYTGSSVYNANHSISGAFNGVTEENAGSWVSANNAYSAGTHNTSESTDGYDGEWIQVDIGKTVVAKEFTFYTRNVTNRDDNDAKKMRLFSSDDGSNWTQVYDWTNLTTLDWRVSAAGAPKALTINQTATGRYFRLAINELMGSVSYTQIAEFEIKGQISNYEPYDVASTNSVLNGQTYTGKGGDNISANFDNAAASSWYVDPITTEATTYDTNQTSNGYWMQVDIGQTIALKKYQIHNTGTSSFHDRNAKTWKLLYSADGSTWSLASAVTDHTDWSVGSTITAGAVMHEVELPEHKLGRYWRLSVEVINGDTIYHQRELFLLGITEAEYNEQTANQSAVGDPETTTYPTSTLTNGYPTTGSILDISGLETNITKLASTFPVLFPGNATSGPEAEPEKFGWVGSANADTISLETTDETDTRTMDLHIWKITITL